MKLKTYKTGGILEKTKCAARKLAKIIAGAALVSGLMLSGLKSVQADTPPKGRVFASLYDHAKTPSIGFGLSKGFQVGGVGIDTSIAISSTGNDLRLESAELDLTTPDIVSTKIGPFSLTGYIYKDNFYYVKLGYGGMLNIGDFHLAGEYIGDKWGDTFAKYVVRLADGRIRLVPKAVILFSDKKVEGAGVELTGEFDIDGVTLFLKVAHSRVIPSGDWMNGNMQAGLGFGF